MGLYPHQQTFLKDESRFRLCLKARQIGLTRAISLEMVRDAMTIPNYLMLCVSPSERQAMNVLSYAYENIRPIGVEFSAETQTGFKLKDNGATVYSLPNNPNTVRGYSANHVYLDEFAHFQNDKEMLAAILPSVSRGGRLTVISTPLGKRGEFWRLWDKDTRFSKHQFDWTVCPDLKIDDIRATMDEISFRQEYCCDFMDEGTSFFPYDLILSAIDDSLTDSIVYGGSAPVYVGVDFGKLVDSTVITAVEKGSPSRMIHVKEFLGIQFADQLEYLDKIARSLKATRVLVDATGYGIPLYEQARRLLGGLVEAVTFTADIKERMATNLRVAFENGHQGKKEGALAVPRNEKLINQLHTLQRTTSVAGTVRYAHREGGHDDYVWSLALAMSPIMDRRTGPQIFLSPEPEPRTQLGRTLMERVRALEQDDDDD